MPSKRSAGGKGLFGGFADLIEKLSELADKGQQLQQSGGFRDPSGKMQGVYGLNIRVGLGDDGPKVEPFGNVAEDEETGEPVVREQREPMVDVFDEGDEVLVLAEMPGVGEDDIHLELRGDVLVIEAATEEKKYRKEVLLPRAFGAAAMSHSCRNGVLRVRLGHKARGSR